MSKIYLLGIFAIAVVVVLFVYLDQKQGGGTATEYIQQTFTKLRQEITKYSDGSSITYLIPDQPEAEKVVPSDETIAKAKDENATNVDKAVEQALTPEENIAQYSKADQKGVVVSGYILLVDKHTGQNIKPYIFRVFIAIECDEEKNLLDGFNYCSTSPIFGRDQTVHGGKDKDGNDLGGYFEYIWHPKFTDSSGFYDVNILVTKDQPDLDGTYQDYKKSYKIQVI